MKKLPFNYSPLPQGKASWFLLVACLIVIASCEKNFDKQAEQNQDKQIAPQSETADKKGKQIFERNGIKAKKHFVVTSLVGNTSEYNPLRIDLGLLNAWGIAFSSGGTAWIAAQAASVSTVYNSDGAQVRPPVNIPSPTSATGGSPTGVVFSNSSMDFMLPAPNNQPARFVFAGDDGVLSAWNSAAGNNALRVKNNFSTAAYKGLALAMHNGNNYLYASNFKTRKIDVWNKNFVPVPMSFTDSHLPGDYSPFNIQNIDGWLYVMYAKVGAGGEEEVGMGNGIVDIYTAGGYYVKRFVTGGQLNAPWGIAKAAPDFFRTEDDDDADAGDNNCRGHNNMILIGNFGNGHINAYRSNGKFFGELWSDTAAIEIEGLWALSFPPSTAPSINPKRLYFTAGPGEETEGLFGYLKK